MQLGPAADSGRRRTERREKLGAGEFRRQVVSPFLIPTPELFHPSHDGNVFNTQLPAVCSRRCAQALRKSRQLSTLLRASDFQHFFPPQPKGSFHFGAVVFPIRNCAIYASKQLFTEREGVEEGGGKKRRRPEESGVKGVPNEL